MFAAKLNMQESIIYNSNYIATARFEDPGEFVSVLIVFLSWSNIDLIG